MDSRRQYENLYNLKNVKMMITQMLQNKISDRNLKKAMD